MQNEKVKVKHAIRRAISQPPFSIDPHFFLLKNAEIGEPILLFKPARIQDSWIVPFLIGCLVPGVAQVSLDYRLDRISVFSSDPLDKRRWIDPLFFSKPPESYLEEIKQKFLDKKLSEPMLTYDQSPTKWSWRIQVIEEDKVISNIYINPSGWYEKKVTAIKKGYEGTDAIC